MPHLFGRTKTHSSSTTSPHDTFPARQLTPTEINNMNATQMTRPGNKWKPGKTAGTWFRNIAILGPCVAENGNITAVRHRVTVPFGDKWSLAALAKLPAETVRITGRCGAVQVDGVLSIPLAARRQVVWHKDGALTGNFTVSPVDPATPVTMKVTGTWKQDDTQGMEAVLFGPL
jgi:hypothetical protein